MRGPAASDTAERCRQSPPWDEHDNGSKRDLNMQLPLSLVWKKDNTSRLLAGFIAEVRGLPEVQPLGQK
jgi:hypothetical protein